MQTLKKSSSCKSSSSSSFETLENSIGLSAGQIYQYLSKNNGEASFSKMKKELDLKGNFADLGLGWLAREDKVTILKSGNSLKIKLN
jgi:hypothetical protein